MQRHNVCGTSRAMPNHHKVSPLSHLDQEDEEEKLQQSTGRGSKTIALEAIMHFKTKIG